MFDACCIRAISAGDLIIRQPRTTGAPLRNVAVGLKRVYPLPDDGEFSDLLARLKRATQRPRMVR